MLGPRGLYIEFRGGACLGLIFMLAYLGKWHRRSGCMTAAEWNIYRFGRDAWAKWARVLAAAFGILATFGMLAYLIKGAGLFLSMFLPFSPLACALIMVLLTVVYTLLSGFYGVVYTDLFQSFIILISVAIIVTLAAVRVAGFDGDLGALAARVTGSSDWLSSAPSWNTPMPPGYEPYRLLFLFTAFYLFRTVLGGMGGGADPRYFGARNERECGKLTFFWTWLMTFRWPLMMGFAILGVFLVARLFPDLAVLSQAADLIKAGLGDIPKYRWEEVTAAIIHAPDRYPQLVGQLQALLGADWQAKLNFVSWEGTVNPERILPAVILMDIPMGVRGLMIVSLTAAAMSTFAPTVNSATSLFTRDIYQAFMRKTASNRELIYASYAFGVVLTLGGFALAYTTKSINDIWDWIIMGLGAGATAPGLLRLYWWRFNGGGAVLGTAAGICAALLDRTLVTLGILHWPNSIVEFVFMVVVSFSASIIGTCLTPPTDQGTLEHFYRTTRPFGLWKPLWPILPKAVQKATRREHWLDIASLPFAFFWQTALFLLPLQAMVGAWSSFRVTLVIFVVSLTGLILVWYRNLPDDSVKGAEESFDPDRQYT